MVRSSLDGYSVSRPWEIRKTTNSAGFTGAAATSMIRSPRSMSVLVIVTPRPTRTRCASAGGGAGEPAGPPDLVRKLSTETRTRSHVVWVFGSKATYCVPPSIEFSRKRKSRRTFAYRHSVSMPRRAFARVWSGCGDNQ